MFSRDVSLHPSFSTFSSSEVIDSMLESGQLNNHYDAEIGPVSSCWCWYRLFKTTSQ